MLFADYNTTLAESMQPTRTDTLQVPKRLWRSVGIETRVDDDPFASADMHDDAFPIAGAKKRQLEFLVSRRVSRIRHGWSAGAILRVSCATRNRKPKNVGLPALLPKSETPRRRARSRNRNVRQCTVRPSAQFRVCGRRANVSPRSTLRPEPDRTASAPSRLPTAPEALKTPTPRCGTRPTPRVQYVPSAAFSSLHRAQSDR